MGLPSSGTLSINDIRLELGASATNQSLGAFSDTAGFAAPDAVSDFYGFSALTAFYVTNTNARNATAACNLGISTVNQLKYHDGSGVVPFPGDTIYNDSAGTSPYSWVAFVGQDQNSGAGPASSINMSFSNTGEVSTITVCIF